MKRTSQWASLTAVLLVLSAPPSPALAAPARPAERPAAPSAPGAAAEKEKPWHRGVTAENKRKALALFAQGNQDFEKSQWAKALKKYEEAIRYWDNPGIRYNMSECLAELNRPLEAYQSMQLALRFGAEALDPPTRYVKGKRRLKTLLGRLARIRIVCQQPGVRVSLDGQQLFVGPGERTRLLDPYQRHVVVAEKHGYITLTRNPLLPPGSLKVVRLKLMPLKKALVMKRRWARWIPWTVLGVGAAMALSGIPTILQAIADFEAYDKAFDDWCEAAAGCRLEDRPSDVVAKHNKAKLTRGLAVTLFALGGAGIATGVALIILNIPRAVSKKPTDTTPDETPRVSILPTVLPGGGFVSVGLSF